MVRYPLYRAQTRNYTLGQVSGALFGEQRDKIRPVGVSPAARSGGGADPRWLGLMHKPTSLMHRLRPHNSFKILGYHSQVLIDHQWNTGFHCQNN